MQYLSSIQSPHSQKGTEAQRALQAHHRKDAVSLEGLTAGLPIKPVETSDAVSFVNPIVTFPKRPELPASSPPPAKTILKNITASTTKAADKVREVTEESPQKVRRSEKLKRLSKLRSHNSGILPVQVEKEVAENSGETKSNVRPVSGVTEEYKSNRDYDTTFLTVSPLSILNSRNINSYDLFELLPVATRTGADQPATSLLDVSTQEELKGKQGKQIPHDVAVLAETTKEHNVNAVKRSPTASTLSSSSSRPSGSKRSRSPPPPPPTPPAEKGVVAQASSTNIAMQSRYSRRGENDATKRQQSVTRQHKRMAGKASPKSPYLWKAMQLSPRFREQLNAKKQRYFTPNGVHVKKERIGADHAESSHQHFERPSSSGQLSPHQMVSTSPNMSRKQLIADQASDLRRLELLRSTWADNHNARMAELDNIYSALDDNDNNTSFINPHQRRDYERLPGGIDSKILPEGIISVDAVKAAAMAHFQEHKIHNRNWNQHVPDIDHIDKSLETKKYMNYQHQSYYEEHGEPSRRLAARRIRQSRAHPAGVSRGDIAQTL